MAKDRISSKNPAKSERQRAFDRNITHAIEIKGWTTDQAARAWGLEGREYWVRRAKTAGISWTKTNGYVYQIASYYGCDLELLWDTGDEFFQVAKIAHLKSLPLPTPVDQLQLLLDAYQGTDTLANLIDIIERMYRNVFDDRELYIKLTYSNINDEFPEVPSPAESPEEIKEALAALEASPKSEEPAERSEVYRIAQEAIDHIEEVLGGLPGLKRAGLWLPTPDDVEDYARAKGITEPDRIAKVARLKWERDYAKDHQMSVEYLRGIYLEEYLLSNHNR